MKNESIVKDMSTGVMVVSKSGQIVLMNDAVKLLFPYLNESDALTQAIVKDEKNSSLYDLIIDSVVNKDCLKSQKVTYYLDDQKKYYDVRSKYVEDEESLIVSVQDVTNEVVYTKRCKDATIVGASVISFIALWNILYAIYQKWFSYIDAHLLTLLLMGIAAIVSVVIVKSTNLKFKEMGFEFKGKLKSILFSVGVTALLIGIMALIKFLFIKDYDEFLDFSCFKQISTMYYPATVIIQEILSRGIMHLSLERVFTGKYKTALAIGVSSFAFAGLHIHLGLMFMLGAGLLLCIFGVIYEKQRSIWALCIPHYFLCIAAQVLGFIK